MRLSFGSDKSKILRGWAGKNRKKNIFFGKILRQQLHNWGASCSFYFLSDSLSAMWVSFVSMHSLETSVGQLKLELNISHYSARSLDFVRLGIHSLYFLHFCPGFLRSPARMCVCTCIYYRACGRVDNIKSTYFESENKMSGEKSVWRSEWGTKTKRNLTS